MDQVIAGMLLVILGVCLIFFREGFAHIVVDYQNQVNRFHFGNKEILATSRLALLIGAIVTILGILVTLGIWKLKF